MTTPQPNLQWLDDLLKVHTHCCREKGCMYNTEALDERAKTAIATKLENISSKAYADGYSEGYHDKQQKNRGMSGHELYRVWQNIKARCYNPNIPDYEYYGGRGIKMCNEWRNNFAQFVEDVGKRPKDTTIDRINNDGNYEPGNIRWATKSEQSANQRLRKTNRTGYKNVYWHPTEHAYKASKRVNGKQFTLGSFKTAIEASESVKAFEAKLAQEGDNNA